MYLFLLKRRPSDLIYDCMNSCVVAAPNREDARQMTSVYHGAEGREVWLTSQGSSCTEIGLAHDEKTGLICRDFLGS